MNVTSVVKRFEWSLDWKNSVEIQSHLLLLMKFHALWLERKHSQMRLMSKVLFTLHLVFFTWLTSPGRSRGTLMKSTSPWVDYIYPYACRQAINLKSHTTADFYVMEYAITQCSLYVLFFFFSQVILKVKTCILCRWLIIIIPQIT